jgi:hypothetical protein
MVTMHAQQADSNPPIQGSVYLVADLCRLTLIGIVLGVSMGSVVACSPLEPLDEPEFSDLQLTMDTLKTSLRDAQRTKSLGPNWRDESVKPNAD